MEPTTTLFTLISIGIFGFGLKSLFNEHNNSDFVSIVQYDIPPMYDENNQPYIYEKPPPYNDNDFYNGD